MTFLSIFYVILLTFTLFWYRNISRNSLRERKRLPRLCKIPFYSQNGFQNGGRCPSWILSEVIFVARSTSGKPVSVHTKFGGDVCNRGQTIAIWRFSNMADTAAEKCAKFCGVLTTYSALGACWQSLADNKCVYMYVCVCVVRRCESVVPRCRVLNTACNSRQRITFRVLWDDATNTAQRSSFLYIDSDGCFEGPQHPQ